MLISKIIRTTKAASLVDYGLIVGLVSAVAIGATVLVGTSTRDSFVAVNTTLSNASIASSAPVINTVEPSGPSVPEDVAQAMETLELINGSEPTTMNAWTPSNFTTRSGGSGDHAGRNYFFAGSGGYGTAFQDLSIPAPFHSYVDDDLLEALMTWEQGSWSGDDMGGITLFFFDNSMTELSRSNENLYPGTPSSWDPNERRADVPAGTRTIRVLMVGQRFGGSNNDAYLNTLDFTLQPKEDAPAPYTIRNASAEQGMSYWDTTGKMAIADVNGADPFFYGGRNSGTATMSQIITIPASDIAAVDAGSLDATLSWEQNSFSNDDQGQGELIFLDGADSEISRVSSTSIATSAGVWTSRDVSGLIPAGTRSMRVLFTARRFGGSNNDGYFDDFSLSVFEN